MSNNNNNNTTTNNNIVNKSMTENTGQLLEIGISDSPSKGCGTDHIMCIMCVERTQDTDYLQWTVSVQKHRCAITMEILFKNE